MGLNVFNIKKWYRMLTGKSILHVNQGVGKCFKVGEVKGYFNDLTEKVTCQFELMQTEELPTVMTEDGKRIHFPVAIFQYGLGAYDLYLQTNDVKYLKRFELCVEWAYKEQDEKGAWNNFFYIYPESPYGAMCQGEGASLLLRAYREFNDNKYLECAVKAIDFMLIPIENGGTAYYQGEDLILMEYTHLPPVLNGWIFAIFGLYELQIIHNEEKYRELFKTALASLKKGLHKYDNGYWSLYDSNAKIASPFYHRLHISQMEALEKIANDGFFGEYAKRFASYGNKTGNKTKAFIQKAFQKVIEK